jgi:hypothetical protein
MLSTQTCNNPVFLYSNKCDDHNPIETSVAPNDPVFMLNDNPAKFL